MFGQVRLAEVNDRHTSAVDQKLLEVPANVVRFQVVVCQAAFLGEVQGRRWTVGLQVQVHRWHVITTEHHAVE